MLRQFLRQLCQELDLSYSEDRHRYLFRLNNQLEAELRDLEPGMAVLGRIAACPERKREDLFIYLMRANLLGQGTGGCRIGLDASEKTLTLSLGLPYEMNYQVFKDTLEDFINYLLY